MKLDKNKVILGMSGGVDSSATAALLLEMGYNVIGLSFLNVMPDNNGKQKYFEQVCSNISDAKNICLQLKIPHYIMDLSSEFHDLIINYFMKSYLTGKTPNPCILCNPELKWKKLIESADQFGARYIATGHFAVIRHDENLNRYLISKGYDKKKEQTYVLWRLSQEMIARTILPLGNFNKNLTKQIAETLNLSVNYKPDSHENCFILDKNRDYRNYLREIVPEIDKKIGPGNIMMDDHVIGSHSGYPFYTIGQRKGLGIKHEEPLYVQEILPSENIVKVGTKKQLFHRGLKANAVNMIKYPEINKDSVFNVKIRYNEDEVEGCCNIDSKGHLIVEFIEPQRAITPGQSVVLYEGDDLVGGGIISSWFD